MKRGKEDKLFDIHCRCKRGLSIALQTHLITHCSPDICASWYMHESVYAMGKSFMPSKASLTIEWNRSIIEALGLLAESRGVASKCKSWYFLPWYCENCANSVTLALELKLNSEIKSPVANAVFSTTPQAGIIQHGNGTTSHSHVQE